MNKDDSKTISLSPTKLNLYFECPRCFWIQHHKLAQRPKGIPPTLQVTFDSVFKTYFDAHRKKQSLPKELAGQFKGKLLPDQNLLNTWRGKGLAYEDEGLNAKLLGKLDECLLLNDGSYIPADYKAKGGFLPKEDSHKFHQNQLDTYTLLMKTHNYKTQSYAYLIMFNPKSMTPTGLLNFTVTFKKVETNPDSAKKHFEEAIKLLKGKAPTKHKECEYCHWSEVIGELVF